MKSDIRFKQDAHDEARALLKHHRLKLTEIVIVAHHYPERRIEMCKLATKTVRQALEAVKLMELTE